MSRRAAVLDAGLQAERTQLAWSRTALTLGGVGGFIVHAGWTGGSPPASTGGALLGVLAAAMYVSGIVRYRTVVRRAGTGLGVAAPLALRLVVVSAALAAPAALAVLFV